MEPAAKPLQPRRPAESSPAPTDLFQAFVEKSWEGFSLLSPTGDLLYVNPATTRILGYPAEELVGTPVLAWIHPEDQERITSLLADAMAEPDRSRTAHYRCRHKDGGWVWLEGTGTNRIDDPAVRGILCNYRDVTDRMQTEEALRESEAELRAIFELAAAGQAQSDPRTRRFVRVNRRLGELTGYSPDELLGLSYADITHPDDRERDAASFQRALRGESEGWSLEKRYLRKDGSSFWAQVTGSLIRDAAGQIVRSVAVIQDIDDRKRAEAALLSSEERFRQLSNLVPSFVWVAEPDGYVVFLNDRWYAYTGLTPEQSLGHGWSQAIHPDDLDRAVATWQAAIRGGGLYEVEVRYHRGDGRYRWFLSRAEPSRDEAGQVIAWFGTSTDVHDRKMADQERANLLALEQESRAQAEAERERAAFLYRASEILTSSLDSEGTLAALARLVVPQLADYCALYEVEQGRALRLVACAHADPGRDEALRELCGMHRALSEQPESALGRVFRTRVPEVLALTDEVLRAGAPSDEAFQLAQTFSCRSALIVPIVARTEVLGLWCLCLSSEKTYDEDSLALVQELARRASGAIENARLYRDARDANDAKDRFLATLSHELRTPLTPVLALAPGLEEDPRIPADARARISRIRRNVELEARLIDDLLDLTRISRGKIEVRPEVADAHSLLEHALSTSAAAIAEKGLRLTADLAAGEPRIWADPPRMTQVFWNLLQNAVKFTPADGTITVRSRLAAETEEGGAPPRLVVEISDTGIGIEPAVLPRIFDAFEQGQRSITRRFGGLGLGLALSKTIVELHGGLIAAESAGTGLGATFAVHLPLCDRTELHVPVAGNRGETRSPRAPGDLGDSAAEDAPSGNGGNGTGPPASATPPTLHILLVEDHADTAEAMAEVLRAMGHEVTVAGTVAEALSLAAEAQEQDGARRIDMVVSDLGLPDGSGVDVMRELARRYALKGIALSGYGMEEDIRRSLDAGFARHLTKPVTPQTLRTAILETARAAAQTGQTTRERLSPQ